MIAYNQSCVNNKGAEAPYIVYIIWTDAPQL